MSDNVRITQFANSTPPDGTVVAADDVGGVKYQIVKIDLGGDGVSLPLIANESTGAITTVDFEHHEIYSGRHYYIEDIVEIAAAHVYDIQFTTADTELRAYLKFSLNCEAETEWYIYEDASIVTAGTLLVPINNNRNSAETTDMVLGGIANASVALANDDTPVAGATLIAHGIVGAGKTGREIERNREIILKQDTIYCIRLLANTQGYTNFNINWYENITA